MSLQDSHHKTKTNDLIVHHCPPEDSEFWTGGFGRSLVGPLADPALTLPFSGVTNTTIRQIAYMTAEGKYIRLRFQNLIVAYSTGLLPNQTVTINEVRVARQANEQSTIPGTDRAVTFNDGQTAIDIFAGGEVVSDSVKFKVRVGDRLSVSIYFQGFSRPAPFTLSRQTIYLASAPGNLTSFITFDITPVAQSAIVWFNGVDVFQKCPAKTIVCFGDSITLGINSTLNGFRDYPDQLADLIADKKFGVLNAGINGNRATIGGGLALRGPAGVARFPTDILARPNVKYVIFLEGTNDLIIHTPERIISGIWQIAKQIRSARPDIMIYGGTIPPSSIFTPEQNISRIKINQWILTSNVFNASIDFATALADPTNPAILNPILSGGDTVHPNDSGYNVMARLAAKLFGDRTKLKINIKY